MPRTLRLIALSLVLLLALPFAAAAQEPGGDVPVDVDLLAVLTVRGKPCGAVVHYERRGESDYFVRCSDGHAYRIHIGPDERVVVEER